MTPAEVQGRDARIRDLAIARRQQLGIAKYGQTVADNPLALREWLTLAAIEALIDSIPPEPFAAWMRSKGCPPEQWALVLPFSLRERVGPFPPTYVQFSLAVSQPVCVRRVL